MSDWADKALKRLNDQRINTQSQNELFLEKQRIKKAFGMPLWLEVRETVKDNCADFNTKARKQTLVFGVDPDTELSVMAHLDSGTRILKATFEESTGKLSWWSDKSRGSWVIEPTSEGTAEFVGSHGPTAVKHMAEAMLNGLIAE